MMKATLLTLGLVLSVGAHAATLTFTFGTIVTSSGSPAGPGPWATAVFTDSGAGMVDLTLTSTSSDPDEFLSKLRLNVGPGVSSVATAVLSDPEGAFDSASYSPDGFTDAGTMFDYTLDLKTSMANRINTGEFISVRLTGAGLDVSDFNTLSTGGTPVQALLHLQGIDGGGSAKLAPVPEPMTALLGLPLVALLRRKRKSA